MPMLAARSSLTINASYPASLLVAGIPHLMERCKASPRGEVRTMSSPQPLLLLEPSTKSLHAAVVSSVWQRSSCSAWVAVSSEKSAMKLARA